jgi:single-strand DNA-binding protein
MVNRVTLIGNLGRDPEIRTLETGAMVAKFSVATDEGYRDAAGTWVDRVEWHEVVAWRQLAERAQSTLKKGMLVYVEGKLSTRKWKDQNDLERSRTEVVAFTFRLLNNRGLGNKTEEDPSAQQPAVLQEEQAGGLSEPPPSMEDDLPF